MTPPTLLEKAKEVRVKRSIRAIDGETIELAIAWARGEVRTKQVTAVTGRAGTNVHMLMCRALRQAVASGWLVENKGLIGQEKGVLSAAYENERGNEIGQASLGRVS